MWNWPQWLPGRSNSPSRVDCFVAACLCEESIYQLMFPSSHQGRTAGLQSIHRCLEKQISTIKLISPSLDAAPRTFIVLAVPFLWRCDFPEPIRIIIIIIIIIWCFFSPRLSVGFLGCLVFGGLLTRRSNNNGFLLCGPNYKMMHSNQKETSWKVETGSATSFRQCSQPQVSRCNNAIPK